MNEVAKTSSSNSAVVRERHIHRIRTALQASKEKFVEYLIALADAYDDLELDKVDQKEFAEEIGIDASYLSKHLTIARSKWIRDNQDKLPAATLSLYEISQLEKALVRSGDEASAHLRLDKWVDEGKLNPSTFARDVSVLKKSIRKDAVTSVAQTKPNERTDTITDINELTNMGAVFGSFVLDMTAATLPDYWKETDVGDEFPLHDLRGTSHTSAVACLVRVKMSEIDFAIKLVTDFGFSYRDTIVSADGVVALKNDVVIVRAERGTGAFSGSTQLASTDLNDVLALTESDYQAPHLLVFSQTDREDWACLVPNLK